MTARLLDFGENKRQAILRVSGIATGAAMVWLFFVTFLFGRFAPGWGPRWFAANPLAFASGIVPFVVGFTTCLVVMGVRRGMPLFDRVFIGGVLLVCLWLLGAELVKLPEEIGDVVSPPVARVIAVEGAVERPGRAPVVLAADGTRFEWQWSFGLYVYPQVSPGVYRLLLTPVTGHIVSAYTIGGRE